MLRLSDEAKGAVLDAVNGTDIDVRQSLEDLLKGDPAFSAYRSDLEVLGVTAHALTGERRRGRGGVRPHKRRGRMGWWAAVMCW